MTEQTRNRPLLPAHVSAPESQDAGMRDGLADSLAYIHDANSRLFGFDNHALSRALHAIRDHRVLPGLFGRYFDLVLALDANKLRLAARLFDEIVQLAQEQAAFAVLPFTEEAIGDDLDRYQRVVGLELSGLSRFDRPSDEHWRRFQADTEIALEFIDEVDPVLREELDALVVHIIAAVPARSGDVRPFGGASSFMLWGAVFLNANSHRTPLDIALGLIHETAHHVLFGLSRDQPLVENAIEESFVSPLRSDPRPMDGIFHATFVCARLHFACQRLLESGVVEASRAGEFKTRSEDFRTRFFSGLETVHTSGRLTPNGEQIMAAAQDYMLNGF